MICVKRVVMLRSHILRGFLKKLFDIKCESKEGKSKRNGKGLGEERIHVKVRVKLR